MVRSEARASMFPASSLLRPPKPLRSTMRQLRAVLSQRRRSRNTTPATKMRRVQLPRTGKLVLMAKRLGAQAPMHPDRKVPSTTVVSPALVSIS